MRRSSMAHSFAEVPRADIPRSSFNRGSRVMTTFDADDLVPVFVDDVIPGDTFNLNMHYFARLATPLYPIMDNLYLESFWFFVPYRLVWDNWTKMHGEQENPTDSIDYTVPVLGGSGVIDAGSIGDYMGFRQGLTYNQVAGSALPFRAYNLIYNDWFRDQNLQDSLPVPTGDANDSQSGTYNVVKRNKRFDYFTGALPSPQKGDAVTVSLAGSAPVFTTALDGGSLVMNSTVQGTGRSLINTPALGAAQSASAAPALNMFADVSQTTGININDLRLAVQTQRLLERDARSGTRYNELIRSHFRVVVPDFRIQRPEFLGGGSDRVNITPVAQTSGQPVPAANDKLGNLASIGTVSGSHGFTKSFVEHGVIIGLINVRADITYSQGTERYWHKSTRYDFYYPVLSQIGEQAILNKEIYTQGTADDDNVFGYQERYGEYRYKPSRLTGLFSVDATNSLKAWHLSEEFSSLPVLGSTFIQSSTSAPLDRAIQIPTEPHFWFDAYIDLQCARPMPLFGVPGNLDRF